MKRKRTEVSDNEENDEVKDDDNDVNSDSDDTDTSAGESVIHDDEEADNESSISAIQSSVQGSKPKRTSHHGDQYIETEEPVCKVAKMSKKDLYKPPTNEELNQLKETENLFHSTLFRLQITELLTEVTLKAKRRKEIENTVSSLRKTLTNLAEGKKYDLQDISWLKDSGIVVPFAMKVSKTKGNFQFKPPVDVRLSGSFVSGTCIKPDVTVDLVVTMPKGCFESKDFLNQRYFRKRALYLSKIALDLENCAIIEEMKFTYLHGNHLKPILVISVKVEGQRSVKMHIHAVPEPGTFKLNRFHVEKNNVRSHWFHERNVTENQSESDIPTPYYNSSIVEDLVESSLTDSVEKLLTSSPSVKEGIVLLKVWLRQRELDKGFGCFNGFIMTMYVCLLLSHNKLNTLMSSYQIFRNTLLKLSQSDWTENGVSMCTINDDPNMPAVHEFHKHFDVVFVDPSGYFNICYSMNRTIFKRVCQEAKFAMKILEERGIDSFEKLFMKKVPFSSVFDHLFYINVSQQMKERFDKLGLTDRIVDYGGLHIAACISALSLILEKALGQRVHYMQFGLQDTVMWDVKEEELFQGIGDKLMCGLVLNPEFAFNVLDRGPSADSSEAEEFRKFWGSKSELRRFQDGGICEAVLWLEKATISKKRLVCEQIVKYVLERHACIRQDDVHYNAGQLDDILHVPLSSDDHSIGTGEEEHTAVIHAYDDLCKMLRRLSHLPLEINSIQGISPCFRYTEVFPPLPCTFRHRELSSMSQGVKRFIPSEKHCPLYVHTLQVICTLEGSGKWPENLEAMKRLKMAFHIQLADAMKSEFNVPVKVGLGYVDVLKDNFVFRLILAYNREIAMLKSVRSSDGKLLMRDTEEALSLERETVELPRLTSTLHGLHQQHPSFSVTSRLAKRWVSAHMLADYIDQVAIELLVASLYLSPAPYNTPSSGLSGFQRFLELLSSFDWKSTPLLINLNNEYSVEDLVEIPAKFSKERSTLPLMFISTPLNKFSSHWTKQGPSANILNRLLLLATKSLEIIRQQISCDSPDFKQVFRPSLSIYDAVIHLNTQQLPRQCEGLDVDKAVKIGKNVDEERLPVLEFDPPRLLLKELKATFGDLCLFFHDVHGGMVIGVLWKPSQLQPREFKVSHINYSKVNIDNPGNLMLTPNIDSVIEDIKIIGKGIISKIEVKEQETFKC